MYNRNLYIYYEYIHINQRFVPILFNRFHNNNEYINKYIILNLQYKEY
jgi:hypothetical protein